MAKTKGGLGRGLGSLFPGRAPAAGTPSAPENTQTEKEKHIPAAKTEPSQTPPTETEKAVSVDTAEVADVTSEQVIELSIDLIRPNRNQPRQGFDEALLEELSESIRYYGILQPLLVRKTSEGYELIAGERRWRAARMAGLQTVPAIVRKLSLEEMTEVALIENVQRENLNAVEEGHAYALLLSKFGLTQEQLAERIGRSRSHIANFLRITRLPKRVQESITQEVISMGQAKPILSLETEEEMQRAADYIIDHELSARQAEALVARLKKDPEALTKKEKPPTPKNPFVEDAEDRLKMMFGAPVHIVSGKKKSRIEIEFSSREDLSRIIETLTEQRFDEVERKKNLLREASRKFTT